MSHLYNPDIIKLQQSGGAAANEENSEPSLQFRSAYLNNPLKIDVPPQDHDAKSPLGDAFEYDSVVSPSAGYGKLTKLPTPILAYGPFAKNTIEIKKRNAPIQPRKTGSVRIVSEFEPDSAYRNRLGSIDSSQAPSPTVRHTSNPDAVIGLGMALASPAGEEAESYESQTFYASGLGRTYKYVSIIGLGAFSVVVLATNVEEPNDAVAIKIVSVPRNDSSNFRRYIIRELGILENLKHPCIVQLLDYNLIMSITQAEINTSFINSSEPCTAPARFSILEDNRQFFYLNYCSGGNLFSWLEENWLLGKSSSQFWMFVLRVVSEILVTINYLHRRRVIHRDIKLENVLLKKEMPSVLNYETDLSWGDEPVCNITDFGLSKRLQSDDQLLTTKCGSQDYVSPELLMGLEYDGKLLDSWSVGVLVYSVLENRLPFDPPPADFDNTSGISPSVLRRRRSRSKPAHRIAMVDWEWYRVTQMLGDSRLSDSAKKSIRYMKALVEALLVRKENRKRIESLMVDERFSWIHDNLPDALRCID